MKKNVHFLARTAIVCALYAVMTLSFGVISYGPVQFRLSELLLLLCFLDPRYILGVTLGCFFANLFGPYGIVDALFGSLHTLISTVFTALTPFIIKNRKILSLIISSLWASILSFIIAFEMVFVFTSEESFWFWYFFVALGEFVVISVVGVPFYSVILKNQRLCNALKFEAYKKNH
ncbi:MAG: QueT transporter family protein [Ruminococcaceae bacterium]|nr:QueT transporter family protein [Oscillospiraceae bacterium]